MKQKTLINKVVNKHLKSFFFFGSMFHCSRCYRLTLWLFQVEEKLGYGWSNNISCSAKVVKGRNNLSLWGDSKSYFVMYPWSDLSPLKSAFCFLTQSVPKDVLMPALHGPHIQNEPQTDALAPTGLPSSCSTAQLTQQGHGQGCPPPSSLTTRLHGPTGSAAAPPCRSTNPGPRSSCGIQRKAWWDEARTASAALCRKKMRCQGLWQRHLCCCIATEAPIRASPVGWEAPLHHLTHSMAQTSWQRAPQSTCRDAVQGHENPSRHLSCLRMCGE